MIFGGGVGSEPSPPKVLFTLLRITVARLISLLQNGATHTRNNYCICYFDWFQTHKPTPAPAPPSPGRRSARRSGPPALTAV